jgi:hypothetical protein
MNKVLQDIVLKTLKAYGQYPDRINSQSLRVPTLAHRYFPVALGVPSVLFETKQAGARAYNLQTRKEIHRSGMMAVARYLSGDNFSDIDRMLAKQISKPKSKPSRGNREMAELLGRGGKTKRWTHRAK